MKTNSISTWLVGAGFGVLIPCGTLLAQQPYQAVPPQYQSAPGYAQQPVYPGQYPPRFSQPVPPQTEYVSPVEFLPTFGRKFGDMFRRLFYGDSPPRGHAHPQAYSSQHNGRSLDQAPGYGQSWQTQPPPRAYPQAPRYERPPATGTPAQTNMSHTPAPKTNASAAPNSSSKTAARKYTPPTISRSAPAKTSPVPPASMEKTETKRTGVTPSTPKSDTASASPTDYFPLPGSQPRAGNTPTKSDNESATKPKSEPGGITGGAFLKGKRTNKEGRVTSPYPPYQELDVNGLSSGSLALDPTTNKVFEVP